MGKEVLQITIEKPKEIKTKFGRWWHWKIWFPVWYIWRPKVLSKFYWVVSEFFLLLVPKKQREELRKEHEEIDVQIINEGDDERMNQVIIDALKKEYDVTERNG